MCVYTSKEIQCNMYREFTLITAVSCLLRSWPSWSYSRFNYIPLWHAVYLSRRSTSAQLLGVKESTVKKSTRGRFSIFASEGDRDGAVERAKHIAGSAVPRASFLEMYSLAISHPACQRKQECERQTASWQALIANRPWFWIRVLGENKHLVILQAVRWCLFRT